MRSFKVCMIEDDQAFLYLAKIIIQSVSEEVEVVTFTDGGKGYDFIEANKSNAAVLPDLILLDLNMPYMDGWQFLDAYDKIKDQICRDIPIYVLSSSISETDINRARANPLVRDFISKPLEEARFAELLKAHETK